MKRLITAVLAAASFALPVSAEIQPGTESLLNTVSSHIKVVYNKGTCSQPNVAGSYNKHTSILTLCPGLNVDADDHDTVRHEVWHAIQHCRNPQGMLLKPVIALDNPAWHSMVGKYLKPELKTYIQKNYPPHAWAVEYEAYVAAEELTSSQIEILFRKACVK